MKLPIETPILEAALRLEGSIDELLTFLREAGVSQMQSSIAIAELRGLSHSYAKQLVIESKAWNLERDEVSELHDLIDTRDFGGLLRVAKSSHLPG